MTDVRRAERSELSTRAPGRFDASARPRRLGRNLYLLFVGVTAFLALAQMVLLPRNLSAFEFGTLSIALSLTQAVQQFGDLGFSNAAFRRELDSSLRGELREYGLTNVFVVSTVAILVAAVAAFAGAFSWYGFGVLALAVLSGTVLAASKMSANSAIEAGDERAAAVQNAVWQNAPKLGMIVGSFGGTALASSIGAVVTAVGFGRPRLPRRWATPTTFSRHARLWAPGLTLVAAAFAASWVDTYILTALQGVDAAGAYQAILRPLLGVTYIYLPVVAILQSAANRGQWQRMRRLRLASVGGSAACAALVAAALIMIGDQVWPEYKFPTVAVVLCAVSVVAGCASTVFGTELLVHGRQGFSAVATLGGAAVLAALTAALVPHLGLVGAAAGSCAGWLTAAVVQWIGCMRYRPDSAR
ncbi:lipopolysaccharide biosynthesis protein [Curtobacterium sp. MWU13-2055]|uniref:lipopolysaccharide biosynthesis protein n=1 Tax=Curtobacterium sp. MWU13-2055 TaxID=2931928 RepID=UPI00200CA4B6|nr:oligosaccharide flippase family protein [Curtobacterium sp. MWU13-2055]